LPGIARAHRKALCVSLAIPQRFSGDSPKRNPRSNKKLFILDKTAIGNHIAIVPTNREGVLEKRDITRRIPGMGFVFRPDIYCRRRPE
jgi:hypothetical protein